MSLHNNPFIRGYWGLNVQRVLEIITDNSSDLIWRPLYPSQERLSDDRIAPKSCLLCNGYAIVTEGQRIPRDLRAQCSAKGFVIAVQLKEALAEARYQPYPEYENRLDEDFEKLCLEIEEAGGTIPDVLI